MPQLFLSGVPVAGLQIRAAQVQRRSGATTIPVSAQQRESRGPMCDQAFTHRVGVGDGRALPHDVTQLARGHEPALALALARGRVGRKG